MLNAEKYNEEIKRVGYYFGVSRGEVKACKILRCENCDFYHGVCEYGKFKWLLSEYKEPRIEHSVYNLKVDDKVEVSDDGENWYRRHFKCVDDESVITWFNGKTSFSAHSEIDVTKWSYARIPREENKS